MVALSERSIAFTRVHAIASSGSCCDNYENFSSYQEKSAGALTFSGGRARPLNPPVVTGLVYMNERLNIY